MDTVTYQDESVIAVLEHGYERVVIDISKDLGVAKRFKIAAIPEAIVLQTDGTIIKRFSGYIAPNEYAAQLKSLPNTPSNPSD